MNNIKLQLEQYVQFKLVRDSLLNETKDDMDLVKKCGIKSWYYKRRLITKEKLVY